MICRLQKVFRIQVPSSLRQWLPLVVGMSVTRAEGEKYGLHFPEFFSQIKKLWLNECRPGLENGVEEMRGPLSPRKTGQGQKESQ